MNYFMIKDVIWRGRKRKPNIILKEFKRLIKHPYQEYTGPYADLCKTLNIEENINYAKDETVHVITYNTEQEKSIVLDKMFK